MEPDERIREIYEETEKEKEKDESNFLKNIPPNSKLFVLGGIGILIWAIYSGKLESTNGVLSLVIIGTILYLTATSTGVTNKPIKEEQCRAVLYQTLKNKQLYPFGNDYSIPQNVRIQMNKAGQMKFSDGKPWKWELVVDFFDQDSHLKESWLASCDVYTGELRSLKKMYRGLRDMEKSEIKYIMPKSVSNEKRYHDYMGKWPDKQ